MGALKQDKWWCNTHQRTATATDKNGKPCCDPSLGGIMMMCECVRLTFVEDIDADDKPESPSDPWGPWNKEL